MKCKQYSEMLASSPVSYCCSSELTKTEFFSVVAVFEPLQLVYMQNVGEVRFCGLCIM